MERLSPTPQPVAAADVRRVTQARLLRSLARGSQVVVLVALYLLWKQFHVPFWTAAEWCLVAGVAVYTLLAIGAAVLLTLARLQPAVLLLAHLTRLAAVGVYAGLRYWNGMGLLKSIATWVVLYLTSTLLVRRMERRAGEHFRV